MAPTEVATGRAHPRLFLLVVTGLGGLVLGLAVALVPAFGADRTLWGIRIGFVGFVLFAAGASGYLAIGVFDRQPGG